MKIKLGGNPIELDDERILTNDVIFPHEYNPHNVRLWVIGNEYGAVCAAWGSCEQEALDEATDADLMGTFLVDEEDIEESEEYDYLGNAGEPADLTYLWMKPVDLSKQDLKLIIALAEARGACADNLSEV